LITVKLMRIRGMLRYVSYAVYARDTGFIEHSTLNIQHSTLIGRKIVQFSIPDISNLEMNICPLNEC